MQKITNKKPTHNYGRKNIDIFMYFYTEILKKLIWSMKTSQQHTIDTFELNLIAVDYVLESY
jgi:hypothetical protein